MEMARPKKVNGNHLKKTNGHHKVPKERLVLVGPPKTCPNTEIDAANERLLNTAKSLTIENAVEILLSDTLLECIEKVQKAIEEPE